VFSSTQRVVRGDGQLRTSYLLRWRYYSLQSGIADARKTYLHTQVKHNSGSHSMRDSTHGHFLLVQQEPEFPLEHRQPRHRRVPGQDSHQCQMFRQQNQDKDIRLTLWRTVTTALAVRSALNTWTIVGCATGATVTTWVVTIWASLTAN